MRRLPIATLALLLAQPPSAPPVGIEMRNVRLHVAADAVVEVKWLTGRLRSRSANPPVFDDQNSYTMEVDDGEMSIDSQSLTALVNRAFDYQGSALSNLGVTFEDGHLVQRGTLKKGITVPFSIISNIGVTADGLLSVHPIKIKTAGVPSTKLMGLFGLDLADMLKSRPERGINFRDNDLFLDAPRMLPAPETKGRLANAFLRGNRLVQVFGRGAGAAARRPAITFGFEAAPFASAG